MEPYNCPFEPLNLLVVVRRAPKLVLPASETPNNVFTLPVVKAFMGYGSILSSHMLLFEGKHYYEGSSVAQHPSHAIARGLERVLCPYYPLAGRLRGTDDVYGRGNQVELVCNGQGAVFVEAQANVSLADLKKMDKVYWSELQYDFVGDSPMDMPPLVVQVTSLTCGGFALSIRVLHSLLDSAGMLHFLHAWSELTKPSQSVAFTTPLWGGLMPTQLGRWPQRFNFPSLDLIQTKEEYAYMEDKKQQQMDPYYENMYGLSNISISLEDLSNLKEHIHIKCNKFEILAAIFWQERTRALGLPLSSEVVLFFPAPMAHDLHLAFYGQYAFNCMISASVGDLIQSPLVEVVQIIQDAKRQVEENFITCMRAFAQLHGGTKRAPPHVFIFTLLWEGVSEIDFGIGITPYAPDVVRLYSPINVASITGGLENTIEIVMTNAPITMADKIDLRLLPTRPLLKDSRL